MAKQDLSKLTDKELEKQWNSAAKEALDAKERARELGKEVERRQLAAQAKEKLESMTEAERDALIQVAQADGIESQEAVHG